MTSTPESITDIAKAIQLALGPVFLLTGVAGLLNVMTGRLSRIVDRGRYLTERTGINKSDSSEEVTTELKMLEHRRRFTSVAITMCTVSALFVCLVIVTLFIEVMLSIPLNWIIGALFTLATLALVIGLAFFLREVHLSAKKSLIAFSTKI
ncbi:MAG TPA: DUF2721 domain-containing protein [Bacteroidia bacterium]|nr:DUF2721 domain-containing protein [Bacteroidia bacterium]